MRKQYFFEEIIFEERRFDENEKIFYYIIENERLNFRRLKI